MRRYFLFLIFVLAFCFTSVAQARKLALLIGVDEYENVPSLKCCVNDIKALKEALINVGFQENDIFILTTDGSLRNLPTKEKIEQKVVEILKAAQPSDMVFFAFSGHGAREGKTDYFCPPFADPENLEGTCVSITKVMDDLAKCEARFKWMVVDACRNDPKNSRDAKAFNVIPAPPAGIALFQSCNKGEKSYEESRDGGHGYFTKNLVEALSGEADSNHDGNLTLMEVCSWTTTQTQAEVEKAESKTQRPFLNLSAADFTLSVDMNVPKANALADEARKAMDEENYALAIKIYDEAIVLCPKYTSLRRERNYASRMLKMSQKSPAAQRPSTPPEEKRPSQSAQSPVQKPASSFKAGDRKVFKVKGVEFAFRYCPPGTFMMGSPKSESGHDSDEIQHQVTLTKGFWMMEKEVTQKQWKAIMGTNPSYFKGDDLPVEKVTWNDCQEFCNRCTKLGLPVQLPTEAQWEYACRAGTISAYAGDLDDMTWYGTSFLGDLFTSKTHPVGLKKSNAWGLYDMHGNVEEWCQDWKGDYPNHSVTDPTGPSTGSYRIIRGGHYFVIAKCCRSADRGAYVPTKRDNIVGFRVVKGQ